MDAYISANDLIKDLCLMNEDFSLSKAAIYASHLKTVINELRIDVTQKTKIAKFAINKNTNSIGVPNDCLLLHAIGYEDDCGVVQPLWYNTKIPQEILFEGGRGCSCQTCGEEHTYCSVIDTVDTTEEDIEIGRATYTKTTKTITTKDGSVIRRITQPVIVATRGGSRGGEIVESVQMQTTEEELCKLELLPCGCVKSTESNSENIEKYDFGCWNFNTNCGTYNKFQKKEYGYTIDITGENIILDISYPYDYVVLRYTSAINSMNEFKIPVIAAPAVRTGIMYYYHQMNPTSSMAMKQVGGVAYQSYYAEKMKLGKRLRPTFFQKALAAMGIPQSNECDNRFEYYNRSWVNKRILI